MRRDALSQGRFFISKMDEDLKNLTRSEVSEMLFEKNGIYKDIYYCARKIKGTSE